MIAFKDFRSTTSGSPLSDGMDRSLVLANEWLEKREFALSASKPLLKPGAGWRSCKWNEVCGFGMKWHRAVEAVRRLEFLLVNFSSS